MSRLAAEWHEARVLEAIFDQLSDALVLYDPDLTIPAVNQAAENLFGMPADEMVGKSCREVFRCGICEPGCGMLVGLNQPVAAAGCTVRLHTASGQERLAIIHTSQVLDEDGKIT